MASSYGPIAAEIAACRASAGIADRSYIAKLELRAPAAALAAVVTEHAGAVPEPGSALHDAGVWWCLPAAGRALVLATRAADGPPREKLERALAAHGGTVDDVTAALAAIELAGRERPSCSRAPWTRRSIWPRAASPPRRRAGWT